MARPDQRGIGSQGCTKILHLKRPSLYPILDDRIKGLYEPCVAAWQERLHYLEGVAASDSPPYWAAFREDLVRNHDPLEVYRAGLAEDENETVRLMAKITRLRLQDIIAWMIALQPRPSAFPARPHHADGLSPQPERPSRRYARPQAEVRVDRRSYRSGRSGWADARRRIAAQCAPVAPRAGLKRPGLAQHPKAEPDSGASIAGPETGSRDNGGSDWRARSRLLHHGTGPPGPGALAS